MNAPTIVPPLALLSSSQSPFAPISPIATAADEVPEDAPEGSYTYALVPSAPAVVEAELESEVEAARDLVGRLQLDGKGASSLGVSAVVHAGLLAAVAMFMPPLSATAEAATAEDQRYLIQHALDVSAEREMKELAAQTEAAAAAGEGQPATSMPSPGKAGAAGSETSRANGRAAVAGPEHNDAPRLGRNEALKMARDFGINGLLASAAGDASAPSSRWGDDTLGRDALSARGNLWAADAGEGAGPGGLSLTGEGDGSNGDFTFIGLPGVQTIGNRGAHDLFARRPGRPMKDHAASSPIVRLTTPSTGGTGVLAPELIQRTVRQNFGRFRACYESGLRGNPTLSGRVSVRFVIGRDGAVSSAASGGSDLADASVVSCVTRSFYGLSFAPPESGIVTVTYPIMFLPGSQ